MNRIKKNLRDLTKHIYTIIFVVLLMLFLLYILTQLETVLTTLGISTSDAKDLSATLQSFFTVSAILIGGFVAYRKFRTFRDFEPHLTITHEVSHRSLSDSYVHIAVTANLHNSSKVHIDILTYTFQLQEVAPASDTEIERLYNQVFEDRHEDYLQWPVIGEIELNKEIGEMIIEPGETHRETFEFIVSTEIRAVMVYSYFENSIHSQKPQTAEGWGATTIYDIVDHD